MSKTGFTLIELLVVITIVAILASVMLPVYSKVQSAGMSAKCISNLRQVGGAFLRYAADHDGELPSTDAGGGMIWTYTLGRGKYLTPGVGPKGEESYGVGVWTCPAAPYYHNGAGGFGVAEHILGSSPQDTNSITKSIGPPRLQSIRHPASTWLVGDAASNSSDGYIHGWYAIWGPSSGRPYWDPQNHIPGFRHPGAKANVVMMDGHAESLTLDQLGDPQNNHFGQNVE